MTSRCVLACAKVNLTLEVLGVRADGFHDLRSWVMPISLADEVSFDADPSAGAVTIPGDSPAAPCFLTVALRHPAGTADRAHLGDAAQNLAVRAVGLMRRVSGRRDPLHVSLVKRIPVGTGLGGGSADAAAVLRGLNARWRVGLSPERLAFLGAELGSDVPALTYGGCVLMEGRGERVTPVKPRPKIPLVLAFPRVFLSTRAVYAKCRIPPLTSGGQMVDNMRSAIFQGAPSAVAAALRNDLQEAAAGLVPGIAALCGALTEHGALGAAMSGSGSCVFGVARDAREACRIAEELGREGCEALVAHTCPVM